jgi:beta-lactamase superfamily II metal-dependent hydrolase
MIVTGDAQMENWAWFDHERMLESNCNVLRAAHHGSANGTQFERIERLGPEEIVVSSDPGSGHHLPDLSSTAIFIRYDTADGKMAMLTRATGTIHLTVNGAGTRTYERYGDAPGENVNLANAAPLDEASNPTDWAELLRLRVDEL